MLTAIGLLAVLLTGVNNTVLAQERGNEEARVSPNATVSQTIGTNIISISYSRPSVNDREVFGGSLVPFGEVWRTGANESTTITFSEDVTIEGQALAAGTYSLYTIPGEDQWTIIFNEKISWGTQYDENQDVIQVEVEPMEAEMMEQMMFYFTDITQTSGTAVLRWDDVKVPFTIKV
ncbi:DUF2911 domain-containing protein [Fodinibius salsisoli]|nr:DUF2911 domain-containing protein [Fodinibius salsisoli]